MRKIIGLILFTISLSSLWAESGNEAVGFWKTLDSRNQFTTSIVAVYQYDENLYGRVIVSYDEKDGSLIDTWENPSLRVLRLKHQPLLTTVDLFGDLKKQNQRWVNGYILDPRSGRTYGVDAWVEDGKLVVRGKLGPFGMRQIFHPVEKWELPYGTTFPDVSLYYPINPLG